MKKIKVCHIISSHKRYDTRVFKKECRSLAKEGYDVTLITIDGLATEVIDGVRIKSIDIMSGVVWLGPGQWIVDGRKKKSSDVSLLDRVRRELCTHKYILKDALKIDAEIYHVHEPVLLPLARKLKKAGKKVVFDSHENYPVQIKAKNNIPFLLRYIYSFIYKYYETKVSRMIDAVTIPCTFENGKDIFHGRSKKSVIISNAPLLSEFYDQYSAKNVNSLSKSICYVGGLTHNRGITHLIKAAYKANAKLILAGTFSPVGYHEKLKKMPEYECVEYRGYINRDQVLELYKEASIGASTLLNNSQYKIVDNLATKTYEYMSMGIPVIISKYPYAEKILKKYNFGVSVDPENVSEIATAIKYIFDNPEKAREMGENGRKAIREMFNWGIEEEKLLNLYDELLKS